MSPQGLNCLQLKIVHTPKCHILGRPVLNPYSSNNRKNIAESLKGITIAFPENTRSVTRTRLECILRICWKLRGPLLLLSKDTLKGAMT